MHALMRSWPVIKHCKSVRKTRLVHKWPLKLHRSISLRHYWQNESTSSADAVAKRYRPWPKGLRADRLPWFDSPLVQGASRLRYTDKAQMQRPGHTGRKALATKKERVDFLADLACSRHGYMDQVKTRTAAKADKKGLKRRAKDDPLESTFDIASVPATSSAHTSPMDVDDAVWGATSRRCSEAVSSMA